MTNPAGAAGAAPSTTAHPSLAHPVLIATLFLAAFAGTCGLVHSRLPFPPLPDLAPRYRYFAEHKDEFDTIFVGSSHLRHGIIPQLFDEEMAKQQQPTHSFNAGMSGMWPPESCYYLRQILALRPRKLRWVFIELMDFRGEATGKIPSMRLVYWHDVPHTAMAWQLTAELALPFWQKADMFMNDTWQFAQNMTNPGCGSDWLEQRYFPVKKKSDTSWIPRRGFDPEPDTGAWPVEGKFRYRHQIVDFQQTREKTHIRPGLASALQKLAGEVEQAGAKPIFIVLPTVRVEEHFDEKNSPGVKPILSFDDPAEFADLYEAGLHYDPGHLNEAGARRFSSLLAERFAHLVTNSPY